VIFVLVEAGFGSYKEIVNLDANRVFDMIEFYSIRQAQKMVFIQEQNRKMKNGK
jgi:hypothetical protein